MDPTHKIDQELAKVGDALPGLWRRMFLNLLIAGFDEQQAFTILLTYILGMASGGIKIQ